MRIFYSVPTGRTTGVAQMLRGQPLDDWKIGHQPLDQWEAELGTTDAVGHSKSMMM